MERPVINVTAMGKGAQNIILEYGMAQDAHIVLQTMADMPYILWENRAVEQRHINQRFPGLGRAPEDVRKYIKSRGKMFFAYEEWSTFLNEQDLTFSFGSRFHGNMASFINGIPTLWVTHDWRTKELVEVTHVPALSISDLKGRSFEELAECCLYDQNFWEHYAYMTKNYIRMLEECGIRSTFN